jgi:hypothetical protein
MRRLDDLGMAIEARLLVLEQGLTGLTAAAAGTALALVVMFGGLAAFVVVLVVLVELFA